MTAIPSYPVSIFIAGDCADARRICRAFCINVGACVTVTATSYIYTGGEEAGVIVGFINYPRFPATPAEIESTAVQLAEDLMHGLYQHSYTIQTPTEARWVSRRPAKGKTGNCQGLLDGSLRLSGGEGRRSASR